MNVLLPPLLLPIVGIAEPPTCGALPKANVPLTFMRSMSPVTAAVLAAVPEAVALLLLLLPLTDILVPPPPPAAGIADENENEAEEDEEDEEEDVDDDGNGVGTKERGDMSDAESPIRIAVWSLGRSGDEALRAPEEKMLRRREESSRTTAFMNAP